MSNCLTVQINATFNEHKLKIAMIEEGINPTVATYEVRGELIYVKNNNTTTVFGVMDYIDIEVIK